MLMRPIQRAAAQVDSLLTSRTEGEQESSRRVKTEFLVRDPSPPPLPPSPSLHAPVRNRVQSQLRLEGAATRADDFVLVIGATNRPQVGEWLLLRAVILSTTPPPIHLTVAMTAAAQELDEAARRRFTKRVYVPLPDATSRRALLHNLLRNERHELTADQVGRRWGCGSCAREHTPPPLLPPPPD
jgi:fidgetin-like protein 1